jgi:hypothetical protein
MDALTSAQLSAFRKGMEPYVVFNEAEWIVFIQHISLYNFKKKQLFAEAGKVCNNFGFVLKGAVRYYRISSFITQSPEERYLKLLENGRDILRRMPQHYIANFLGITPVSLSRIRKRILVEM